MIDQKTSLLIKSQLPEFIRDEQAYANFVLFLEAYYEWLEQNHNVSDRTKNLLNYKDIDKTSAEFLDYFYNDFLAYFPQEILADKTKVTKLAKELYQSKGTPSSYKFLFRILYNSDVELFYTKDAVLKASAGKWYVPRSLKLSTTNLNFLKTSNLRVFGLTTKSIATIETAVESGTKIEVFISNIERLFQSGEIVRVVDSNNQPVLFDGQILEAKIVGQISQIKIDPNNRGLFYQPNDPVVVYNGLNTDIQSPIGATAQVNETTKGSIQRIKVETGGYGYRENPNTTISITNATGAIAVVGSLNPDIASEANVSFIPTDIIGFKKDIVIGNTNYHFTNVTVSNASTTLINTFSFLSFSSYPISSVLVENGGGGITIEPKISAQSLYSTDNPLVQGNLKNLGILAPIQITDGGLGYQANDTIVFSGGSGYGAHANVTSVNTNGSIVSVNYVYKTNSPYHHYPLGGLGYNVFVPEISVQSSNVSASGASLYIPGILGDGATFTPAVDRVGSISSIKIINPGEDYISIPSVSLKVQDIAVNGLEITNLPQQGDIVYQGTDFNNSVYLATVDSINILVSNGDPLQQIYNLRVYNYNAKPVYTQPLKIDRSNISMNLNNTYTEGRYDSTGVITYGDGTAKATASYLNGLVVGAGQYLDTTGQPSSFDVIQSQTYNNYTYEITLEKEIEKYRKTLLSLLHPTGMKVLGRFAMNSLSQQHIVMKDGSEKGHTLGYYTNDTNSYVEVITDWVNQSNNAVSFYELNGTTLDTFLNIGDTIAITTDTGNQIDSVIEEIDSINSQITLGDDVWLTFANVATVTANAGSNTINITSLTGSYDIINNGNYSDFEYPLKDIAFVGDKVLIANNTEKIISEIDYVNNIIYLTTNLTNDSDSLMSVNRTFTATDVKIFSNVTYDNP